MAIYRPTLWLASFLLGVAVSALGNNHDSNFCQGRSNGLHPDPINCEGYYNCHAHRTFWMKCGPGTVFNSETKNCDWERNVDCQGIQRNDEGGFCSGLRNGLYPDPEYCQRFYSCSDGRAFSFKCPPDLFFNSIHGLCDWEKNVDCSGVIEPKPTVQPEKKTHMSTTPNRSYGTTWNKEGSTVTQYNTAVPKVMSKTTTKNPGEPHFRRIVCYFTNWAQYRNGKAKQLPEDLDPFLCTHIVFAFAKFNGNRLTAFEWNDEDTDWSHGNYRKVIQLKERNPNLKVLIAVGGWKMGSAPFTAMVDNPTTRKEFVDTSISFLRSRGFDGLDLDWEYPENEVRFSSLLRELRKAFNRESSETGLPPLLLTAAVAAGKETIDKAYDVPVLNSELDFINLMSYDLHGYWDGKTGHNSPLYPGRWETGTSVVLNIHLAASYWVEKGASREKLVIGVPFYGRTFQLKSTLDSSVGAETIGPGKPGMFTKEKGFLAYYEVCEKLQNGASKHFIEDQRVPYIVYDDQWVGYDDPVSLKEKVKYIRDRGYGGVMVWDLSLDDLTGDSCGEGRLPLLTAVNDAYMNA